jgi:hypothetical protein
MTMLMNGKKFISKPPSSPENFDGEWRLVSMIINGSETPAYIFEEKAREVPDLFGFAENDVFDDGPKDRLANDIRADFLRGITSTFDDVKCRFSHVVCDMLRIEIGSDESEKFFENLFLDSVDLLF